MRVRYVFIHMPTGATVAVEYEVYREWQLALRKERKRTRSLMVKPTAHNSLSQVRSLPGSPT